jgi:hypothetical protein
MIGRVTLAGALLLCAAEARAACWISNWAFTITQQSTAAMRVTNGDTCPMIVGQRTSSATMKSVRISAKPRNGTATANPHGAAYTPKAGFKGQDSFAFEIAGTGRLGPGTATVTVEVAVY